MGDSTNFCDLSKYLPEKTSDEIKLTHKLTVFREIVYVAGRYLKLQRGIAQTGDEQVDEEDDSGCARLDYSIERAIDQYLRKYVDYSNMILTAAGREDIDVRMLGSGRPFILQLEMSKNCQSRDWKQILKNMNADFAANGGYI